MSNEANPKAIIGLIILVVLAFIVIAFGKRLFVSVPAGHVAVATLFGKIKPDPYKEGLHFPVNPLLDWTLFDAREKSHKEENVTVTGQDQLGVQFDVSVQYRIDRLMAAKILGETGDAEQTVNIHLVPKLRSTLREQSKSIRSAEEFFMADTQGQLQVALENALKEFLAPKGVIVDAVLLRDMKLPPQIQENVARKKQAEQEVERQKAELERQKIELQKEVESAKAQRLAAEEDSQRRRMLADAQAYEIQKINEAIANNPAYIKLEALKALQAISKDPAAKVYFMNGESPMPLPLMMMGENEVPMKK
jgi:regulator of protease activity HflC (stomatin/prohibitin superfamily)